MSALAQTLRRLRHQAGASRAAPADNATAPVPAVSPAPAARAPTPPSGQLAGRIPPVADPALRRLLEARLLRQAAALPTPHGHRANIAAGARPAVADASDRSLPGEEIAPGLHLVEHWPAAELADEPAADSRHMDLPRLGARNILSGCARGQLLFFDTETTGLAGGTGTRAFMIGAADWQQGRLRVRQLLLSRLAAEAAMLEAFRAWLSADTVLVSYNGRCYDAPLLAARYRLARLGAPLQDRAHLDLLHATRRRYRGVWENCRLATVERQLLGVLREDDLPGSEAPGAFLGYLRGGSAATLRRVLDHNRQDVVSLARLLDRLLALPAPGSPD